MGHLSFRVAQAAHSPTHRGGFGSRSPTWEGTKGICLSGSGWPQSIRSFLVPSTYLYCHDFMSPYSRPEFHSAYVPVFHYPFIIWRTFRLFPLPSYWLSKPLWCRMVSPLSTCQGTVWLGHMVDLFIFLKLFHTGFHSGCTSLQSHQQWMIPRYHEKVGGPEPRFKHLRLQCPPPQWHTSSNVATPTPAKSHLLIVLVPMGQASKHMRFREMGHFCSNHHSIVRYHTTF